MWVFLDYNGKTHHSQNRDEEDSTSADFVDDKHVYNCEDKVGSANDDRNCCRLVKSDQGEECPGIIHQGIEPAELGDYFQS